MKYELNDKEVEVNETEFEFNEYACAINATFVDTGIELNDEQLDAFNTKYAAELYEDCYTNAASDAYDLWKDSD